MEEDRARELVARRTELVDKFSALLDEYRDVLAPGGVRALRWCDALMSTHSDDEDREEAERTLAEFDEDAYAGYHVRAWGVIAELAPMSIRYEGSTIGFVCPPEQLPMHSNGLYKYAAETAVGWG